MWQSLRWGEEHSTVVGLVCKQPQCGELLGCEKLPSHLQGEGGSRIAFGKQSE